MSAATRSTARYRRRLLPKAAGPRRPRACGGDRPAGWWPLPSALPHARRKRAREQRRISRSREARAAEHELAVDGRRRRSRRIACRDQASRRCRGDRTHTHTFAPTRRGESPQPRGRLDRGPRQTGTPFLVTERSVTERSVTERSVTERSVTERSSA